MSSGSYFSGSLTVSQLATKVVSKVDTYLERLAGLLKEQQILEDKVSSCKTLPDCHRLRHEKFGVGNYIKINNGYRYVIARTTGISSSVMRVAPTISPLAYATSSSPSLTMPSRLVKITG